MITFLNGALRHAHLLSLGMIKIFELDLMLSLGMIRIFELDIASCLVTR